MSTFELPAYIDPAVLRPGQRIRVVLGTTDTVLTVVRVEPMLICQTPDGDGVVVFAHAAIPLEDDES